MERDVEDTRLSAPHRLARPSEADHDDTVVRGDLPHPPPALVEPPAWEPPPPGPEPVAVPGVPDPEPVSAPAFRVLFLDGTVLPVDRTLYLGRKPSIPRIHTGPEPRLVTLPSPARELSSTHLELRVVGGSLVASDMRSTNGTVVRLPGSAPRTLIRGESAVVVPGTRIDLGEGAVLDVLAAPEAS